MGNNRNLHCYVFLYCPVLLAFDGQLVNSGKRLA
jgi:hypothetical protein